MPLTPILIERPHPAWTLEQKKEQHQKLKKFFHSLGLTVVTQASVGMLTLNAVAAHRLRHPQLPSWSYKRVIPCSMSFCLINYILLRNLYHIWHYDPIKHTAHQTASGRP